MSKSVEQVWVIQSNGLCAVHRNYSNNGKDLDDEIFSGFVVALFSFARSLKNGGGTETIRMKGKDIHYLNEDGYTIVIAAVPGANQKEMRKTLVDINESLLEVCNLKTEGPVLNADDPSFEIFKQKLDELMGYGGNTGDRYRVSDMKTVSRSP